jgi:hypothetical protein
VDMEQNKFSILNNAVNELANYYKINFDIGEYFMVMDVFSVLKKVSGVLDVTSVRVVQKTGGLYSDIKFSVDENTSSDGRMIYVPENCVFEIKYPTVDIAGSIK